MRLDFNTCTPLEMHDAARAAHAFHLETSIAVTRLGGTFHIFDLNGDVETKLDAANTSPERLLAHAQGFLANRLATRA